MWAFGSTAAACLWGVALLLAAALVPAYSSSSGFSDAGPGLTVSTSATLIQENGTWVLIPIAIPLVICLLTGAVLDRRCRRGGAWTRPAATGLVVILFVFALVGALSVGPFVLPAAVLLAVGARLTPDGPLRGQA